MAVLPSATKGPSGIPAAPASAGSTTVGRSSPIRHRLLLSLALAPWPLTLHSLAQRIGLSMERAHDHAVCLREEGLVAYSSDGYRLRPGVVVGGRGYVGYVVPLDLTPKPCGQFVGQVVPLESGR